MPLQLHDLNIPSVIPIENFEQNRTTRNQNTLEATTHTKHNQNMREAKICMKP